MIGSLLKTGFYVGQRVLAFTLIASAMALLGNGLAAAYKSVHLGGEQQAFDFGQFADEWKTQAANAEDRLQNIGATFGISKHADESARVVHVADGDTFTVDVDGDRKVIRIIGVDTPETKKPGTPIQCYGPAASAHTKSTLLGHNVTLSYDRERTDKYGRTLAYVSYRDHDYSASLIRQGYARTLTIPPNTANAHTYAKLERAAKKQRRGLWGVCQ